MCKNRDRIVIFVIQNRYTKKKHEHFVAEFSEFSSDFPANALVCWQLSLESDKKINDMENY